jgi:hypothetical protein
MREGKEERWVKISKSFAPWKSDDDVNLGKSLDRISINQSHGYYELMVRRRMFKTVKWKETS